MYRTAEEKINKGLSPSARVILGIFAGFFGLLIIVTAPPTDKAVYVYIFGGFCLLICVACMTSGRVRQFVGSAIGLMLFGGSLLYMGFEATRESPFFGGRGEPSLFNSFLFLLAFGVPGVVYAAKVRFGLRKASADGGDPISERRGPSNH